MKPKKLKLTATTVRTLSCEQLATVPGGASFPVSIWKTYCASTSIIIKP